MTEPNGAEILQILLDLYAEQEHVKITYEIESKPEYIAER